MQKMNWVQRARVVLAFSMVAGRIALHAPLVHAQLVAPDLSALSNSALTSLATGTTNGVNYGITGTVIICGLLAIFSVVAAIHMRLRRKSA